MSYSTTEGQMEPIGTWSAFEDLDPIESDLGDDFDFDYDEDLYEADEMEDPDPYDPLDES